MRSLFRTRALVVVLSIAALGVVAVGAQAAKTKATGGTTTITPSTKAAQALNGAGLTLAPLAPGTAADGSIVLPIKGGHFNPTNLRPRLFHAGGIAISNGKRTVRFRHFVINSGKKGAALYATTRVPHRIYRWVRRHHKRFRAHRIVARIVLVRLATLTNPQRATAGSSVTVTLKASKALAFTVNHLAKKHIVSAGAAIGTATVAPTTA